MILALHTNAAALNRAIDSYVAWSGKSLDWVLQRNASKLAYALQTRLKTLMPSHGQTTQQRLRMMATRQKGMGIHIHQGTKRWVYQRTGAQSFTQKRVRSFRHKGDDEVGAAFYANRRVTGFKFGGKLVGSRVKDGKRINLQNLLVKRELASRESGRGFTSRGSMFANLKAMTGGIAKTVRGLPLSQWGAKLGKNPRYFRFEWSEFTRTAVKMSKAMTTKRALAAAAWALKDVADDTMDYVYKKMREKMPF
jgi:hypothetical protein